MQGKEEAAGKKRKQAAMDSCTLPHKINKWHLLPFIINHLIRFGNEMSAAIFHQKS